MIVYKVVKKGSRRSTVITGPGAVTYLKGVKTVPVVRGAPLMAFKDRESAERFRLSILGQTCILKCKATPSRRKYWPSWRLMGVGGCSLQRLKRFWTLGSRTNRRSTPRGLLRDCPEGTVFCANITPLE